MTSTGIDGSPILIITVEEAKVAKTAISMVQALHGLGDLTIHDPEKWERVCQKFIKFLDEAKS